MGADGSIASSGTAAGSGFARRAGAFVADPDTRNTLQRALPGWTLDVHEGNIRTAVGALAGNASPEVLLVDLDGVAFPVGSIHELASVCEVGTSVVALGSRDDARFSRNILTTGVTDYLVKPISPDSLREVVADASMADRNSHPHGRSAGFTGTGGSGATTLLAATATAAAESGRYVTVLDLGRAFSTLPFLLNVEPAPGLEDLLESAANGPPDPDLVNTARFPQSDRISVYGYRWNPVLPPPAAPEAVRHLLAEFCQRSHLVLVEPEPHHRAATLRECDISVLVTEPTPIGDRQSARVRTSLGADHPFVHVRNHTRHRADLAEEPSAMAAEPPPDIEFPFEADLSDLIESGRLFGHLPRRFQEPLQQLTSILATSSGDNGPSAAKPAAS